MQKAYDHKSSEQALYAKWEASGLMCADENSAKKPFTIVLPPPNVTGTLHLGHAAMLAIEDIVIRYKRMNGHEVLWLPGTDHAAIATESVVLKKLGIKDRNTEISREKFMEETRHFVTETGGRIREQMKSMGAWLDWSREAYTFDEARNHAVNFIFKKLYEDGLIERGHRLINWSAGAQSVISDDELEYENIRENFYYIRCGEFVMSTVRPETKCADSPLVVHPTAKYVRAKFTDTKGKSEVFILAKSLFDDEKKRGKMLNLLDKKGNWKVLETLTGKELEGQKFSFETYAGKRDFSVIADEVIDPEKGTGAMTISSCHSVDDYDLAQRRKLDKTFVQKIDFHGKMTDLAGPCQGMTVLDARKKSAEIMREKNLLVGIDETYEHSVPKCYRSNCMVEPMISPQWFIMVEKEYNHPTDGQTTLKAQMQAAVREGHVKIIPERFEKIYFQWIDNLRDWCISRQIWWGHRIPVWYSDVPDDDVFDERCFDIYGKNTEQFLTEISAENWQKKALHLPIGKLQKPVADTLKLGTQEIFLDSAVFAKLRGWNTQHRSLGHQEFPVENFYLLSAILSSPSDFVENIKHKNRYIILTGKKDSFVVIIDARKKHIPRLVSFFFTTKGQTYLKKSQYRSWHLEGLAIKHPSFTLPHLRRDLARLAARFSSRQMPRYADVKPILQKNQVFSYSETQKKGEQIHLAEQKSVYCVRHGEGISIPKDLIQYPTDPLTEKGRAQAEESAKNLRDKNITKIIASPAQRTRETAEIIAEKLGISTDRIEYLEEFKEVDFGSLVGKPVIKDCTALEAAEELGTGESRHQLWDRVEKGWQRIKAIQTDGDILLVGHQTIFSALDALLHGKKVDEIITNRVKNEHMSHEGVVKTFPVFCPPNLPNLRQDPDTLDTWFSSALWPFSTLGWPIQDASNKEQVVSDFDKFYPNDVLETGNDIIFFWVARMIMFGKYATGKYPFHTAYLHGMVTDEHGKKMSKSKGNGIDPMEVIDQFGADPVRLSLVIGTSPGNPIPIGENKIKGYRNFVNKLWNAGRFVQMRNENVNIKKRGSKFCSNDKYFKPTQSTSSLLKSLTLVERWILSRFSIVAKQVSEALETYQISVAGDAIYHFVWNEFCAWYLEGIKHSENNEFLHGIFAEILKLTHPLCPFVTEEIWKEIYGDTSLMTETFPSTTYNDDEAESSFESIKNIVGKIRNFRSESGINPKDRIGVHIEGATEEVHDLILLFGNLKAEKIENPSVEIVEGNMRATLFIPVDEKKISAEKVQLEKEVVMLEARLANASYTEKAPAHLVQATKNQLEKAKEKLAALG